MEYFWDKSALPHPESYFPAHIRPLLLPAATKKFLAGADGMMLLQQMIYEQFSVHVNHFLLNNDSRIYTTTAHPLVTMHFMLEGIVTGHSDSFDGEGIHSGSYHIFYVPASEEYQLDFQQGDYHSVRIDLNKRFLRNLLEAFPMVARLIEALDDNSSHGIQLPAGHINFRIKAVIAEILDCDPAKRGADLLLHARVYELLWLYLTEISSPEADPSAVLHFKKIKDVRDYVDLNLDQDLGTALLAKRFCISNTTLKRQFKAQCGLTIREYLIQQRMEKAMELLTHSDLSIHTIGARVGYLEFSSFTRAFTKYYQHSPIHFRRDNSRSG